MLRIGRIPYLNCEPFFAHLDGWDTVPLHPRALGQAAAEGRVDTGPFSLVDLLSLGGAMAPLPFGIATGRRAASVFLFSRRPLTDLGGAVVGVTDETSTSVELLRLLLAARYEARPRAWVGLASSADAVLLIGDGAIQTLKSDHGFPYVTDLGEEWVAWTGLPCVFARWGIRASLPAPERAAFKEALAGALERGLADLPSIATRRGDTGFSPEEVVAYLRGFTYRLGDEEEKAIAEFRRLRELLGDGGC